MVQRSTCRYRVDPPQRPGLLPERPAAATSTASEDAASPVARAIEDAAARLQADGSVQPMPTEFSGPADADRPGGVDLPLDFPADHAAPGPRTELSVDIWSLASGQAVFELSLGGVVLSAGLSLRGLLGLSPVACVGRPLWDLAFEGFDESATHRLDCQRRFAGFAAQGVVKEMPLVLADVFGMKRTLLCRGVRIDNDVLGESRLLLIGDLQDEPRPATASASLDAEAVANLSDAEAERLEELLRLRRNGH